MAKKFAAQYKILGMTAPDTDNPREKAELIFQAACKKEGIDPALLPDVDLLNEEFRVFPVSAYKLEVIKKALVNGKEADWNDGMQRKYGAWNWMNKPGFRFLDVCYAITHSCATGGPRLCVFSEQEQEFYSIECGALWADFSGGQLPK